MGKGPILLETRLWTYSPLGEVHRFTWWAQSRGTWLPDWALNTSSFRSFRQIIPFLWSSVSSSLVGGIAVQCWLPALARDLLCQNYLGEFSRSWSSGSSPCSPQRFWFSWSRARPGVSLVYGKVWGTTRLVDLRFFLILKFTLWCK